MVKTRFVLTALTGLLFLTVFLSPAFAWSGTYHLPKEWAKIWINQDGSIDLFYNISITLDSGDNINFVKVGQPQRGFSIKEAYDQYGNSLSTSDVSSGNYYGVQVNLHQPLTVGDTIWFILLTNVANMVYYDTMNPGNLGLQFIPCWWPVTVNDVRVVIILPQDVTESMLKTSRDWNNTYMEEGQLAVFWENQNLSPDEQFPVGVSFPKEYLPNYTPPGTGPSPSPRGFQAPSYLVPLLVFLVFIGAIVIVVGLRAVGKHQYFAPIVSVETLGILRGLTAVEASYLLEMKPTKIVTEMLYSLLQKRAVWVESAKPFIKLRIMPKYQSSRARKELLRYYETDFLNAIKPDGTIDEVKLAQTVMKIRDTVEDKMRGYCRRDTIAYYRKIVAKAWKQVKQAGTPKLASKAYNEQLLWLFLDPNYQSRTKTTFRDKPFEPDPFWFWYWYSYRYYHPKPTYKPNIEAPTKAAKPPTIPGADFANNIAKAVEGTSNKIVTNLEKFANAIIPMPAAKSSTQPAHHKSSCVCACAACACVCACVSCACACAGGGVG